LYGTANGRASLLVSQLVASSFRYFDRIHLASVRPSFNTWREGTSERIAAGVVADPAGGWLVTPAMLTVRVTDLLRGVDAPMDAALELAR